MASLLGHDEDPFHFSGGIHFPTLKSVEEHWGSFGTYRTLNVSPDDIASGEVAPEIISFMEWEIHKDAPQKFVEQLAELCRKKFQTDHGIATHITSNDKSEGTAHISLATPKGIFSQSLPFISTQNLQNARTVKTALNMLRLHLLKYKKDDQN